MNSSVVGYSFVLTTEEFIKMLDVPKEYLMSGVKVRKTRKQNSGCCDGNDCN